MKQISNKLISVIISLALIVAVIGAVPVNGADSVIIEKNISAMYDIKDYGPEFVYDYIVPESTEDEIVAVLENIKQISDEVTANTDDEYEIICALDNYVSNLIAYDHDAAHNDVSFDTICLKNVLERNRTTCAGYSNLFAALAQAQGLYCVNIRGSAPDSQIGITIDNLADENTPINHEWNAVWYEAESRWIYVDCTWNSLNSYENGEFSMRNAVTTYLDPDIELLSLAHKADSVVYRDFFSAAGAYFENEMTAAVPPNVTTTVTGAAITTTSVSQTTSVQTQTTNSSQGSAADSTLAAKSNKNTSSASSEGVKNLPAIIFFVTGCLVLVGGVVYAFKSPRDAGKNDKNDDDGSSEG